MLEWYPSRQLITLALGVLVLMTGPAVWAALLYLVTLLATTTVHKMREEAAWAEPSSPSP